ncbi:hypothetical protein B0O99DRAFT_684699 [Bisporella sp. PMI_857]|nr:hypothetical protein B0O99DRAFT_684699 [Bisporella sp. PMI_857]
MTFAEGNRKLTLEKLLVELVLAILGSTADIRSLAAVAFSCSTIYPIFIEAQSQAIPQALFSREISEQPWNFVNAVSVIRLYHQVNGLATDFASQSKSTCQLEGKQFAVSKSELKRYERAFYRFELYCNLFGGLKSPSLSLQEQRDAFFSKFSPSENEQLACVHDYLCRLLSPAYFNEMGEHDVMWSEMHVDYADFTPTTWRYTSSRYCHHKFLYQVLNDANAFDDGIDLEDYTVDNEIANIANHYFKDPDIDSSDTLCWAHQMPSNGEAWLSLREWGYIMWDRRSLDKIGVFEVGWGGTGKVPPTERELLWREQRVALASAVAKSTLLRGEVVGF